MRLTLPVIGPDRVEIVGGGGLNPPPVHVYRHPFWVKIGFKFNPWAKFQNISAADPPVLLGQFQHWCQIFFLHLLKLFNLASDRIFSRRRYT